MCETFGIKYGTVYVAKPGQWWVLCRHMKHVNWNNTRDQNYGQFVLVTVPSDDGGIYAGQSWMVDTYDIERPGKLETDSSFEAAYLRDARERRFVTSWWLGAVLNKCYYCACFKLTEDTAALIEEGCDLHEYDLIPSGENASDYENEDIVGGVRLFREHAYGTGGAAYVRKGAARSLAKMARVAYNKAFWTLTPNFYDVSRELATIEECLAKDPGNQEIVAIYRSAKAQYDCIERFREEYQALIGGTGGEVLRTDEYAPFGDGDE